MLQQASHPTEEVEQVLRTLFETLALLGGKGYYADDAHYLALANIGWPMASAGSCPGLAAAAQFAVAGISDIARLTGSHDFVE